MTRLSLTLIILLSFTGGLFGLPFSESSLWQWAEQNGPGPDLNKQRGGECGRFVMEALEKGGFNGTPWCPHKKDSPHKARGCWYDNDWAAIDDMDDQWISQGLRSAYWGVGEAKPLSLDEMRYRLGGWNPHFFMWHWGGEWHSGVILPNGRYAAHNDFTGKYSHFNNNDFPLFWRLQFDVDEVYVFSFPPQYNNCNGPRDYWSADSTVGGADDDQFTVRHMWACCWKEKLPGQAPWATRHTPYACLDWTESAGTTWDTLISPRANMVGCTSVVFIQSCTTSLSRGTNTIEIRGSTDDGATWPYLIGTDTTRKADIDWAAGQGDFRVAWIYKGRIQEGKFWCIDDVGLWTKPPRAHDVSVSEVKCPKGMISPGKTLTPSAFVWNYGAVEESLQVTFRIGDIYTSSCWVKLPPICDTFVAFPAWAVTPGTYTARCYVSMQDDEVRANDTASLTFRVVADTWVRMFEVYGGGGLSYGACLATTDTNTLYCITGKLDFFAKYLVRENLWKTRMSTPYGTGRGGAITYTGGNYLYAFRGGVYKTFYRYSISSNTWSFLQDAPERVGRGGALAWAGGDYIYAQRGNYKRDFWRYRISTNTWSALANTPEKVGRGGALVWTGGDYLYALRGYEATGFYRYQISTNTWTARASVPVAVGEGGALTYDPNTNRIYAFCGDESRYFYSYNIAANSWSARRQAPYNVREGGCLAYCDHSLYGGVGSGYNDDFWRYSPPVGGFDGGETQAPADVTLSPGTGAPPGFGGENVLASGEDEKLTPQYSPDGDWIVYVAHDTLRDCLGLYRVDAKHGGEPEVLIADSISCENPRAAWNTDWLVVAADSGIFRVSLDTAPQVTRLDSGLVADPAVTTDDSFVFYTSWDSLAESQRLYRVRCDGTERTCLTPGTEGLTRPQAVPGGNSAVCVKLKDEVFQLCLVTGDTVTWLTSDYMNNVNPRVSAGGSKVTYEKLDESGYWQVYAMPTDGQNETRVTDGTAPCLTPVFSPDGRYVCYTKWPVDSTGSSEYSQVCYADLLQPGSEVVLTAADAVREAPAWSPDGQDIVFVRTTEEQFGEKKKYKQVVKVKTHIRFSGVEEPFPGPRVFTLDQNRPNPFKTSTAIRYAVPRTAYLDLAVYDVTGRLVTRLVGSEQKPGYYSVVWRGEDARGRRVPAGTYYYLLRADDKLLSKRMLLVR